MRGPRRVLHYTRFHTLTRWGGREQVVAHYCQGLVRHGIQSEVYATAAFAEPGEEVILGTRVRRFPYLYPYFPLSRERRARMDTKGGNPLSPPLLAALRREPPDLVHLHTGSRLGAQILRFCQRRGIPVVYSLHGGAFVVPKAEAEDIVSGSRRLLDWGKVVGWRARARRLTADVDRVLCVGKNEYLAACERGLNHAVYLPNGVDEDRFGAGDGARFRKDRGFEGKRLVLCCGRIDTQKNQRGLVTDLGPLLRTRRDVQLLLVGSTTNTDYRTSVFKAAQKQDVKSQVHLLGNLPPDGTALPDVYAAADLLVLPSIAEPFGIVILEAWAARRPVAASAVDGIPHFVESGKNGLLFDPGRPGEICAAVTRLIEDAELAARLAAAGREMVELEFTWTGITERLATLYRSLWCQGDETRGQTQGWDSGDGPGRAVPSLKIRPRGADRVATRLPGE